MAVDLLEDLPTLVKIEAAELGRQNSHKDPAGLGRAFAVAFVGAILGIAAGAFAASGSAHSFAPVQATDQMQLVSPANSAAMMAMESDVVAEPVDVAIAVGQPVEESDNANPTHQSPRVHGANSQIGAQGRVASARLSSTKQLANTADQVLRASSGSSAQPKLVISSYVTEYTLDTEEPSQESAAQIPAFTITGDLMVVDLDVDAKTIETSDGRTFTLDGESLASVTDWGNLHSAVYYRCAQGGQCVLRGPGATSVSARQI